MDKQYNNSRTSSHTTHKTLNPYLFWLKLDKGLYTQETFVNIFSITIPIDLSWDIMSPNFMHTNTLQTSKYKDLIHRVMQVYSIS
jgi:hypothetical protein